MRRSLLLCALALCACQSSPEPKQPTPTPTPATPTQPAPQPARRPPASQPAAKAASPVLKPLPAGPGEVVFTPRADWRVEEPSSRMRKAQLGLPGGLQLVIYHFGHGKGGTVEANLARWIGQLQQPDGSSSRAAAKVTKQTVNGLEVHRLDLSGTYVAAVRPGAKERHEQPNQRLLAAVIVGGKGPYFVKLIGPADRVAAQAEAFDAFLAALRVAS